jgi:hypothetical protein
VCSSTGIVTSPNEIDPFQIARGMMEILRLFTHVRA